MVDIFIFILIIMGIFIGLRRGFIMQFMHLTGFIIAFVFAVIYYDNLAPLLELWIPYPEIQDDSTWAIFVNTLPLEHAFYNAVAFAILFFGVKIILQIVANMLDFIAELPVLNSFNGMLGAVLGFIEVYFILFIMLYFLSLVPVVFIQKLIDSSFLAQFIVEHTPVISNQIKSLWFTHVADYFSNFSS
ncbi:putative membrane protein required for colicin V production [Melghiribacillus thermohalophilus]|uniref:Putative membrane protein required for colicin V production n=2 Tax=Melghiribacillus thermohalophilus TaxID=1324956 RepID=A0A4R3N714_9BACI|nr:CvpA family protein [Melghiribacillus thermohalophilus]TCT25048.1 putative membrane protein required for colicin V production [Melghiribacillus thermohalophilus]